jgi:hypothetical protein
VIVWVFAGGGQSEIEGLFPYLKSTFQNCQFELCTPFINKVGAKPKRLRADELPKPQGYTDKSLLDQIKERLIKKLNFKDTCDLIVIFDDLDYPSTETNGLDFAEQKHQKFEDFLTQIWQNHPELKPVKHVIGFAKPELESWVIADWEQTLARDPDFRDKCKAMQHWLVSDRQLSFSNPENFGLDPAFPHSYHQKLSNAIIDASEQKEGMRYSKQLHTARFIKQLDSAIAQQKCPEFRKFFSSLTRLTQNAKSLPVIR